MGSGLEDDRAERRRDAHRSGAHGIDARVDAVQLSNQAAAAPTSVVESLVARTDLPGSIPGSPAPSYDEPCLSSSATPS